MSQLLGVLHLLFVQGRRMNQLGLFESAYPRSPGVRPEATGVLRETSEAAAKSIAHDVKIIRARCLQAVRNTPAGLTADEVADKLDLSVLTVRPRMTELHRKYNLIRPSGERRRNVSGKSAAVMVAV